MNTTLEIRNNFICSFGNKVDSISYFSRYSVDSKTQINALQSNDDLHKTNVAFITFKSQFPMVIISQAVMSKNSSSWRVTPAPYSSDIEKSNLHYGHKQRIFRSTLVFICMSVLIIIIMVPITFIQSVSNLENLATIKPLTNIIRFIQGSFLNGIISGLLPSLSLILLNAFLPDIIRALESQKRFHTRSELDRSCFVAHYAFLITNTLFVSTVAGLFFMQSPQKQIQQPILMISKLANTLPTQASFFMTYIILQGLSTFFFNLVRPKQLIKYLLFRYLYSKTKEEIQEAADMGAYQYSIRYAQDLMILTITIVYSVIAPPILVVALLYFCLAYVVERYNIIFVYKVHYEGGGIIWPSVVTAIFIALITLQLLMFGIFTVLGFIVGTVISLSITVITILYWIYLHQRFYRASKIFTIGFMCYTN